MLIPEKVQNIYEKELNVVTTFAETSGIRSIFRYGVHVQVVQGGHQCATTQLVH